VHVHKYEKIWLFAGVVMLVVFLATITTAAVVDGFVPPSRVQSIDPAKVSTTPPFDRPGLHRIANNQYEAYCVGHIFAWEPSKLAVPAGAHVTFYVTSTDVVNGFSIPKTGVNTMVSPGWVSSVAYTFAKPGASIVMFVVVAVGTRLRNDLATEPVPFAFATVGRASDADAGNLRSHRTMVDGGARARRAVVRRPGLRLRVAGALPRARHAHVVTRDRGADSEEPCEE